MYTRILNIWADFRSSFWFIPLVMMAVATLSAFFMIRFDSTYGKQIITAYPMFEMSPPSARSILSSIVGAMVTSTGVVFSITIVALSLASSQFGSRLLRTYRNRRTTHFTLGIFVSTSLFCILVLASIREVNDLNFVPTASVVAGILMTVVCLGTLVYYIHDMSRAIQAPNVIQSSADDLDDVIARLFPDSFGEQVPGFATQKQLEETSFKAIQEKLSKPTFSVEGKRIGYIQAIENESVLGTANDENLVVRLLVRPGDFLFEGCKVAEVIANESWPAEEREKLQTKVANAVRDSFIVGSERTHLQDVGHAFNELVEIAVRALSPGINDPFTAVNCVDRIHAALVKLRSRSMPSAYRLDAGGQLRVIARPVGFEECIQGSLGIIRNYAEGNSMVLERIEEAMESLTSSGLTDFENISPASERFD